MKNFTQSKYLKPRFLFKSFLYCALLVIILFSALYILFLKPPANFPVGGIKNIPSGGNLRSISLNLKEEGYVKSRLAFESFVIMYGGERRILPGAYLFKHKLPVFEVARRISFGVRGLDPVKITIPEGMNNREIAEIYDSKLPNFTVEKFLELAVKKQGYLFPDTYFFFPIEIEENIIKNMEDNFEKKIESVRSEIQDIGKTEKEIIIMASIIEREARGDADREYISGILWKRLAIGMPLQVDAWPETYKQKGLPQYPIGNPGLKAIKAAIYPKKSDFLYYLHAKDGKIYFAKNFDEHKRNIAKYLR